ncbi:hypothetical protein Ancab_010890 [Ancistrocladus abbreviatus]
MRDHELYGVHIPKNTFVFVKIWSIGTGRVRWTSGPSAFCSQRRGRPSLQLAMQEVPTVLPTLIQGIDWRVNRPFNMNERPGLTVSMAKDLVCILVSWLDVFQLLN